MSELQTINYGALTPSTTPVGSFLTGILSSIPSSIAKPILDYQKTKAQKELIALAIEAKKIERIEILRTLRALAECGQLTPELSSALLLGYCQSPISELY